MPRGFRVKTVTTVRNMRNSLRKSPSRFGARDGADNLLPAADVHSGKPDVTLPAAQY